MAFITNFWQKFSDTKLLSKLSTKLEMDFFENVYRVTYISGLSTSDRSFGYLMYSNTIKVVVALFMCSEIWYILTKANSLDAAAQTVSVVLMQSIALYRYANLISNKSFYDKLVKSMNSPYFDISTEARRKLVETWAQRNKFYLNVIMVISNSTLIVWCLYPLIDEIEYNLITDISLPFYYKTPILYKIVYLLTVVALAGCAYSVIVTASVIQAHLLHLLCQFCVLAHCFENVILDCNRDFKGVVLHDLIHNNKFADKYTRRLKILVKQHQLLLSYTRDMKAVVSRPMLLQLGASGTMLCCVAYQAVMTITQNVVKCLVAFMFLSYNVFELYIICRWCELIRDWSIKIGDAIYYSGWEFGMTTIKGIRPTIILVIARANKPVVFTAGGMYDMSIASFASLVKASYSVLTILLRFRHD